MKIAIGSDEKNVLTDFVIKDLIDRNYELALIGPLAGESLEWTDVAEEVANKVAKNECEQGILFCWTGTGVTIAANKVPGVRAALCTDAGTAEGARKWNDANILTMSLRLTSNEIAKEILDAWFNTDMDPSEKSNIKKLDEIEKKHTL
ncbi:MAG: RpiB/LacA/LacB family sugar-phosphate isomerase [Candidatus Dadabacteria bacterium]|nr:RpiB/LacA/LacB family sugar-phosphate isomerase [Candidatus Dadabacteria bacterium]NIQ16238.1 RpiB/LacA/LacB family sugar-phosphate isomerase [Candidatus Dadabacteria bacterium]